MILSIPARIRIIRYIIRSLIYKLSSRERLRMMFEIDNFLYAMEGKASVEYGGGLHTKHRHINYHRFFIENITPGECVLDIGSGNGFLSYDIVTNVRDTEVVGIELDENNIRFANTRYRHPGLTFIHGDALKELPDRKFDVVVLSNILEHIEERIKFLKEIIRKVQPKRLIIRVPAFERDWRVPLKKELGVEYRLDVTHCIEYTRDEYIRELQQAGLCIRHIELRWGEIWSVAEPERRI